jgi:dihydrofolate reductase
MAGPNGDLSWFVYGGFQTGTEWGDYARDLIQKVGAVILGRRTYEEFVGYWPTADDNDPVITERINNLPKYVFSRSLSEVNWGRWGTAFLVKEDLVEWVRRMKQKDGKDLVVYGSGEIVSQLTEHRLIDEYQLVVHPLILGNGTPEFRNISDLRWLKLMSTRPFKTGAILHYYHPAQGPPFTRPSIP